MIDRALEESARHQIDTLATEFTTWLPERRPLPPVERGSRLELDDTVFPEHGTSHLVETLINSSREHLFATGHLWHSRQGTFLMPRAYSTLLHTSLLAAATACWILEPDDRSTRVARSLMVAIEDIQNATRSNEQVSKSKYAQDRLTLEMQEEAGAELARMKTEEAAAFAKLWEVARPGEPFALNRARDYKHKSYSNTSAVRCAYEALYPDGDVRRTGGVMYWHMMSGDSHGFRWQTLIRARHTGEQERALAQTAPTVRLMDTTTCALLLPQIVSVREVFEFSENLWRASALSAD